MKFFKVIMLTTALIILTMDSPLITQGMVLSLGIPMMFVLIRGVKMETERVCSNENVAKLSMMSGISQTVVMMETRIGELETTVYKSVKEKNATLQTKKDLLAYKKNISTPQLEEMESSYHCDHVPVNDCCQVLIVCEAYA